MTKFVVVRNGVLLYLVEMGENTQPRTKSALLSFKFLGTAIVGSLVMTLVCTFGPTSAQLAILGAFISILGGLFISFLGQEEERQRRKEEFLSKLPIPFLLADEPDLYEQYTAFSKILVELAKQNDPILREIAVLKLASVTRQIETLANGTVVFAGTESWRTVYETLLQSRDIHEYLSVAWVHSKEYWQDQPGRQSMLANFAAAHRGTMIERIIILRDDLWPKSHLLPGKEIYPWIEEQHNNGIRVLMVRESDLAKEPDLLLDFGIYGQRAVGIQEIDERCRTTRFLLHFDAQQMRLAKDRWKRLALFATSLRNLLDKAEKDG